MVCGYSARRLLAAGRRLIADICRVARSRKNLPFPLARIWLSEEQLHRAWYDIVAKSGVGCAERHFRDYRIDAPGFCILERGIAADKVVQR